MEEKHGTTINVKLMAKREDFYTVYVFKNLETGEFITVSKPPNWNSESITVNQEGFLTYRFVQAGRDCWWDNITISYQPYKYSANYFLDFVPISHVIANTVVTKKQLLIG